MNGLVSVIVPVFNREHLVQETLESILNQTYKNIEIIAVNDGSTDDSLKVLQNCAAAFPNIVRVIDQDNQGQVESRNNAIRQSNGEFIAFLDSDDLWLPEKLEKQIPLFAEDVGLVYCGIYKMDDNGKITGETHCEPSVRGNVYTQLLTENKMTGGTVVLSKKAIEETGLFDINFSAAENWDLWIRVSKHFLVDFVDEPLLKYRTHGGNMSKDGQLMGKAAEQIISKHCIGDPDSPELEVAYRTAFATLAYKKGVNYFTNYQYKAARVELKKALSHVPNFRDCKVRILRTYLGRSGNKLLSTLKTLIPIK